MRMNAIRFKMTREIKLWTFITSRAVYPSSLWETTERKLRLHTQRRDRRGGEGTVVWSAIWSFPSIYPFRFTGITTAAGDTGAEPAYRLIFFCFIFYCWVNELALHGNVSRAKESRRDISKKALRFFINEKILQRLWMFFCYAHTVVWLYCLSLFVCLPLFIQCYGTLSSSHSFLVVAYDFPHAIAGRLSLVAL